MSRKYYYWICAKDPDSGQPYLIFGSEKDETECRTKGIEMLGGLDFDIKRYPTRDLATASAYLRGKRLESTHSLRESSRRIGHSKSLRKLKRKQSGGEWDNILY